jgi:hypothetical protein
LADLAIETGVEAVLDFGRSVRLRHMRAVQTPVPGLREHPSIPVEQDQARIDEDHEEPRAQDVEPQETERYQATTNGESQWSVAEDDKGPDGDGQDR